MKITLTENRVKRGKNNYLVITCMGGFLTEFKFDFNLLKCFVCIGADLLPHRVNPYNNLVEMNIDIEKLRTAYKSTTTAR